MNTGQFVLAITLSAVSIFSYALEEIVGKITYLEPTYMPDSINLNLDAGNETCPAGQTIIWDKKNTENHQAVYATLLAGFIGGNTIRIYINDKDFTCHGQYIHILRM